MSTSTPPLPSTSATYAFFDSNGDYICTDVLDAGRAAEVARYLCATYTERKEPRLRLLRGGKAE